MTQTYKYMKKYGNLQIKVFAQRPALYDKETRLVSFGIEEVAPVESESEEEGGTSSINSTLHYEGYQVELDTLMDYGHIKSQLIEAAYSPKDEFGLAMNTLAYLTKKSLDKDADEADAEEFLDFQEYRTLCAQTAKEVMRIVAG
jgi:hypothetical protein